MLKAIAHDYIPRSLLRRLKMGFAIPVDSWLRGFLERSLATEKLDRAGLVDGRRVGAVVRDFLNGEKSFSRLVWSLLMLEIWYEQSQPFTTTSADESTGDDSNAFIEDPGVHADSELCPNGRRG